MALQIIERRWCDGIKLGDPGDDWVMRHDAETAQGKTRVHALDGGKPRTVDLCDPCNTDMTLEELRVCLKEFGSVVEAGKKAKATPGHPVDHSDTVAKWAVTGQRNGRQPKDGTRKEQCLWCPLTYSAGGWGNHLQKQHGFTGIKEALGQQCPRCGEDGFQTIAVHIQRSHAKEFDAATEAFIWARDNGDPYHVYAARRAAGTGIIDAPEGLL